MQGKLLYIGYLPTAVEPVIQVTNGSKAVITSIRVCAPANKNGTYEIHHVPNGGTSASTTNSIAFNAPITTKESAEFLTKPLAVSPGESIWVSGDGVTMAIYGVIMP